MPSDFEREYKEYIESTTPDFWDKIEAGIADEAGEQATAVTSTATSVETTTMAETTTAAGQSDAIVSLAGKSDISYVNQDKKVIKWGIVAKRIGQFAAVAALLLVSYGVVTLLASGGMKSASSSMSDSAAPAAAEAPAAEAMAEAAEAEAPMYDDMEPMAEEAEAPAAMDEAALDSAMSSDSAATEAPASTEGSAKEKDSDAVNSLRSDENKKTAESLGATYDAADASGVQIITEAVLTDITELSPTQRSNSSGDQYKYGMSFVKGDETINCMMTEAELKSYAKGGLHLRTDASYNITVQLRDDYDPASSEYPYVLKMIEDAK